MRDSFFETVGSDAREALLREAEATPKPGLVDRNNTGVHRDMDLPLFRQSAEALGPFFSRFTRLGAESAAGLPAGEVLSTLRPLGVEAERAMFLATTGVNTHQGAIFILGVLCAAAGRLAAEGAPLSPEGVCREAGRFCAGMEGELADPAADSHGARCYRTYGVTGVRGEAARGFPSLLDYALPWLSRADLPEDRRLCAALLSLAAHVDDTTVLHRAGAEGAAYCKAAAWAYLRGRDPGAGAFLTGLAELDMDFIGRNISPGGSADLLAAAIFLRSIAR